MSFSICIGREGIQDRNSFERNAYLSKGRGESQIIPGLGKWGLVFSISGMKESNDDLYFKNALFVITCSVKP